jgi:enterobactin synthetase component D
MPTVLSNPALFPKFVAQYTVGFDDGDPRAIDAQFPGIALPAELACAVRKRQLEFAAGRHCVREALRRCSPQHAGATIPLGPSREPLWPAGIVGTITHTRRYASVAVARTFDARAIGLDVEPWIKDDVAVRLVESIADIAEVEALARVTGLSFSRALTLTFSAKETVFKCFFPEVRRYFDFRDVALVSADARRNEFTVELLATIGPRLGAGACFEGRFEYDSQLVRTAMTVIA